MELLRRVKAFAKTQPDQIAIKNMNCKDKTLTYEQLENFSNSLAVYLQHNIPDDKTPIIVYGHKNPYMMVSFLACVKSGHPYCPVEASDALERVETIIGIIHPHIILALEPFEHASKKVLELAEIKDICNQYPSNELLEREESGDDLYHILFTSGSTGQPKGVEITMQNMDSFLSWMEAIIEDCVSSKMKLNFLNQSSLSFDLSVMEVDTPMYMGGTLHLIDSSIQANFKYMMQALKESKAEIWAATPSLAELCLKSRKFSPDLMPQLKFFFLCGEILTNTTAGKLLERFPTAKIINAYGPTEATVAVTIQEITTQLVQTVAPLPVGKSKPGCDLEIWQEDGTVAEKGVTGEIVIKGDSVAQGYFKQPELTQKAFVRYMENGKQCRGYRTGDLGYLDSDNILHFVGRADTQIQLHGYRIELGDVEQNLMQLESVSTAVVVPKLTKEKTVKYLAAYILPSSEWKRGKTEQQMLEEVRNSAKNRLADHMVPQKFIFVDDFPRNRNSKIDRKKLQSLI